MRFVLTFPFILGLFACATTTPTPSGLILMPEREYHNVVESFTGRSQKYAGLYNTMDVTATLVNSKVALAQIDQKARLLQWDSTQYSKALEKQKNELAEQTIIYMSFYTPDKKNDDLQKPTTQWRMYLEAEGRRWEPRVVRIRQPIAEIQGLYSYHTRFSTAYQLTFPIAATTIDQTRSRFIVTGPLGISTIEYPTN